MNEKRVAGADSVKKKVGDSSSAPVDGTVNYIPSAETEQDPKKNVKQSGRKNAPAVDPGATIDPVGPSSGATKEAVAPGNPTVGGTLDFVPGGPAATIDSVPSGTSTAKQGTPKVPGYEILGTLGRGAMGVVYKARQRGLNRLVALKMILAGGHASEHDLVRFRTEGEAVARLQHPNIVQVYDVGEADGHPYFSLEYVEGGTLSAKVAGIPQPPKEAAKMVQTLALAMKSAHAKGIVHRDLKPANIMLTVDGDPKIADFGLAKQIDNETGQTQSNSILGTPSYMAPEQAEGKAKEVGPLADVYSLGAILYDLLTGRPPFRGTTIMETLHQVRGLEPVAPTQLQPKVARDLETICLKCLQKDAGKRYKSAGALAGDLGRFLRGEPINARPVSRTERAWRWCRRNPFIAGLGAAVAMLMLIWAGTASIMTWKLAIEIDAKDKYAKAADTNAEDARNKKKLAEEQTTLATEQTALAVEKGELAEKNASESRKNQKRAEANAGEARDKHKRALDQMILLGEQMQTRLRSKRLPQVAAPEMRKLRDDMMDLLRLRAAALSKDLERNEISSFALAGTMQKLGDLLKKIGKRDEASALFREAHDLIKQTAQKDPKNDKARANLAVMLIRLGEVDMELSGDARAARVSFSKAWDLQEEILKNPKSGDYSPLASKVLLSHWAMRRGDAELALGHPFAACGHYEKALEYREYWVKENPKIVAARSFLGETHLALGIANWHRGDAKASETNFVESLKICEALSKGNPKDITFKADLVRVHGAHAAAQLRLNNTQEAFKSCEEASKQLGLLVKSDPDNANFLPLQAMISERLAGTHRALGNDEEAVKHFQDALHFYEELSGFESNNLMWRSAYLVALARTGKADEAVKGAEKLAQAAPRSTELLLQAARCHALAAAGVDGEQKKVRVASALDCLQLATQKDYQDTIALETDPDLRVLAQEPAFQTLLAELKKRSPTAKR